MIIKDPNYAHEYYGMSTDTKPLSVPNASLFYEIDTCDIYMFDEDGKQWFKQSGGASGGSSGGGNSSGSGSSSGSAANVMILKPAERHRSVVVSSEDDSMLEVTRSVIYDKTWQEVHDALAAGTQVFIDADFLLGNQIENTFMQESDYHLNNLYAILFSNLLYAQASNNEQPATLYPISGAFVSTTATGRDTETGSVQYEKHYTINRPFIEESYYNFVVNGNRSDGAIYCEETVGIPKTDDYNSELDDAYEQWLNEGNNSDISDG